VVIYREPVSRKIAIVENLVGSWSQKDVNSKKTCGKYLMLLYLEEKGATKNLKYPNKAET
jgi:hypothetical protein